MTAASTTRRVFLWVIVVSFSLAALTGIGVLLGAAEFTQTVGQVMGSTALVGAFALAMLCCAAVFSRPGRLVGVVGAIVSALTLSWSLVLVWGSPGGPVWETLATGITLTIALAFASLLLALTRHLDPVVRTLRAATLVLFLVSSTMILIMVWDLGGVDSDGFGRALGVALILAVLGGVVTPLLSSLRRRSAGTRIDPRTITALQAQARRRGITVEELVAPLLRD